MKKIEIVKSKPIIIFKNNIDTDILIPKNFLKTTKRSGFEDALFSPWRYDKNGDAIKDFPLNIEKNRDRKILVTGDNFGCGSSREHAAWALLDYGIDIVIAGSYSPIFYMNYINNNRLPIILDESSRLELKDDVEITVDLVNKKIIQEDREYDFNMEESFREKLVKGEDNISEILKYEDKIKRYEESRNMKEIVVLKGDGVGEEIINSALKILEAATKDSNFKYNLTFSEIGGAAIDKYDDPFPIETIEKIDRAQAVLLGAVGGPKWDNIESEKRPEKGLLRLRKYMGVYINLRPAKIYENLLDKSPIKNEIVKDLDILVVRELLGGIYFGKRDKYVEDGIRKAYDIEFYDENEIRRIAEYAFKAAKKRKNKVTLVDKANVLDSSKLWREVVKEVHSEYKDVELEFLYVDNTSMQLIKNPRNFDVILTNNIFGDILSDELSEITGSIGLLPSASIGDKLSLYEPSHGSAPDIAGKNIVNPIATILSVAMMLRFSFNRDDLASKIEVAIKNTIEKNILSFDLNREKYYTTKDITDEIIKNL